jgi:hypothetical protein
MFSIINGLLNLLQHLFYLIGIIITGMEMVN